MALSLFTQDLKNATPEFKNLFRSILPIFAYTAITPVYYMGAIAASEYVTYDANKLYVALNFKLSYGSLTDVNPYLNIYNEADVLKFVAADTSVLYNVTPYYRSNYFDIDNIYFSRIGVNGTPAQMIFNGYKLTK